MVTNDILMLKESDKVFNAVITMADFIERNHPEIDLNAVVSFKGNPHSINQDEIAKELYRDFDILHNVLSSKGFDIFTVYGSDESVMNMAILKPKKKIPGYLCIPFRLSYSFNNIMRA